jgi:UDP-N-acetylmuramate dehydrogenase
MISSRPRLRRNVDLTWLNAYRLEAKADLCAFPRTTEDLLALSGRPWSVIGGGHNLILSKPRYGAGQPLLCLREFDRGIARRGVSLTAGAGASLRALCLVAAEHGLAGLESLWDIPSTLGGAVVMNAGAYGRSIHEMVESVEVMDMRDGRHIVLDQDDLASGYRKSALMDGTRVVTGVRLKLAASEPASVRQAMRSVALRRRRRFPYHQPNAGSVFKRPPDRPVGWMIEQLGLKGATQGGAVISPLHGGFIVNRGDATGADILALARRMQDAVAKRFSTVIELEQVIV